MTTRNHSPRSIRRFALMAAALVASLGAGSTLALWQASTEDVLEAFRYEDAGTASVTLTVGDRSSTAQWADLGDGRQAGMMGDSSGQSFQPTDADLEHLITQGFVNIPVTVQVTTTANRAVGIQLAANSANFSGTTGKLEPQWHLSLAAPGTCAPDTMVDQSSVPVTPVNSEGIAETSDDSGAGMPFYSSSQANATQTTTESLCLRGYLPKEPTTCDAASQVENAVTGQAFTCAHYDNTATATFQNEDGSYSSSDQAIWSTDELLPDFQQYWKDWAAWAADALPNATTQRTIAIGGTALSTPRYAVMGLSGSPQLMVGNSTNPTFATYLPKEQG